MTSMNWRFILWDENCDFFVVELCHFIWRYNEPNIIWNFLRQLEQKCLDKIWGHILAKIVREKEKTFRDPMSDRRPVESLLNFTFLLNLDAVYLIYILRSTWYLNVRIKLVWSFLLYFSSTLHITESECTEYFSCRDNFFKALLSHPASPFNFRRLSKMECASAAASRLSTFTCHVCAPFFRRVFPWSPYGKAFLPLFELNVLKMSPRWQLVNISFSWLAVRY